MTVAELIEKLREFPPDMLVVSPGFDEFGYDDVCRFDVVDFVGRGYAPAFAGRYVEAEHAEHYESPGAPFRALCVD